MHLHTRENQDHAQAEAEQRERHSILLLVGGEVDADDGTDGEYGGQSKRTQLLPLRPLPVARRQGLGELLTAPFRLGCESSSGNSDALLSKPSLLLQRPD